MRIAIFAETFLPKWDGIANTLCHFLEYLAGHGHMALMFAPEGAPEQYAGTPIVGLPAFAFPFYPDLRLVPPLINVERRLADFRPDIVHIVNPAFLGLTGLHHARKLHVPVVASYHTDLPGYTQIYRLGWFRDSLWTYFRWLHNQADLNLAPSNFTRLELEAHGFERVSVWSRGVDTEQFHPRRRSGEWRARLTDGHPDAPLLLYVGRLAVEKRIEWLRPVLDTLPHVRLAIVGDGPLRPTLEAQFAGTPTVFTGHLRGDDLAAAYAAADLFTFPSANETFGNVVLEAMASGLPAIAPRAGGPVDLIIPATNGFLCAPADQAEWLAFIRLCVEDPALLKRMGLHARRFAESRSWDKVFDELLRDYATPLKPRFLSTAGIHPKRFPPATIFSDLHPEL
ncbi:MAG TPA: glycosyltransferase family 1 protein [Anaerolineae bacterium]|nr:glycosyltransferase family 1 protein [Anaerolineae bacterium]HQI87265.1 glycosyltransferase family 1 protein [Anaerolineae bacterium]